MPAISQTLALLDEPMDLLLGADNDLVVQNGDLVMVAGVAGVAQCCRIALQLFEGEVFFDLTAGIPYLPGILGARESEGIRLARTAFAAELLSVQGVSRILQLDLAFNRQTRKLAVRFQVSTIFGDSDLEELTLATVLANAPTGEGA